MLKFIFTSVIILLTITSKAQVRTSITSVTVSPAMTNQYGEYQIEYKVTNGNGQILAGRDSVYVTFPNEVLLPNSIDPSSVSFGGIELAGTIKIIGQQVRFVASKNVFNGETALIRFSSVAKLRNPSSVGSYTLTVFSTSSSINNGNGTVTTRTTNSTITSPSFSIVQSNTTISAAAVTPDPSVSLFPASYTISFQLGAGGYLEIDDKFYIEFPTGTTVPQGFISGITVNGTNAVALTNGKILEITATAFYDNLQFLQVIIPKAAGFRNPGPTLSNPYKLKIYTESETTVVNSSNYNISSADQLSFSSIAITPDTVNMTAAYLVSFYTGNPGALSANTDFIELTFPTNTKLPASINSSRITITNSDGFSDNPSLVNRISDTKIRLRTPLSIASSTEVIIRFQENLGIKNPSHPGSYTLLAKTLRPDNSEINAETSSNPYAIFGASSTIDRPSVVVSGSNYTIQFNTGIKGGLTGGLSKIYLSFPSNIGAISSATINSTTIPAGNRVINGSNLTITIPNGVEIANNAAITLQLNGLTNPSDGTYAIVVSTSAEQTQIISSDYTIGGSTFQINSAPNIVPQGVNQVAKYELYGLDNSGNYLRGGNDFIRFIFPEGVYIPETIELNQIETSINNNGFVNSIETSQANRSVTLYLERGGNGQPNQTFQVSWVKFLASAGIRNPSIASSGVNNPSNTTINTDNFRILVSSSRNPNYTKTPTFTIQPSGTAMFTVDDVSVSPNVRNANNVALTIKFTPTTGTGKLVGGSSLGSNYLRLNNSSGFQNFPNTIDPAFVTLNGVSLQRVERNSNSQITMYLPDGLVLEAGVQAELKIGSQIGLAIVNWGNSGTIQFKADVEYSSRNGTYNYSTTVGNLPTVFEELIPSVNTVNAPTAYTLKVKLGSSNTINIGNKIRVTFPENTFIPATISASRIKVNGISPNSDVIRIGDRVLEITSPVAIPAETYLTILLSSTSGVLNPSLVAANYSASVTIPTDVTVSSSSYGTTDATSTVSVASVEILNGAVQNPSAPNTASTYTIRFNTGDFGRLYSGSTFTRSTITIKFPNGTVIPTAANSAITVNGVAVPQADRFMDNTAKTVTIRIPSGLETSNNSPIVVSIPNITNPNSVSNTYTVRVSTSVEPNSVESNTYSISNNGPVTFISATNINSVVNQNSYYVIRFRTSSALIANSEKIIYEFPEDTGFRGAIPNNAIEIELYQDAAFTISSGIYAFSSSEHTISPNSRTISSKVGIAVPAGTYVELRIKPESLIRNPREPDVDYTFKVATSLQPYKVGVSDLEFLASENTKITNLVVERSTSQYNTPTTWNWSFTTGANGGLRPGRGTVTLRYLNANISVPNGINVATITLNQARPQTVITSGRDVIITVPNGASINAEGQVVISISGDAGIIEVPPSQANNSNHILKAGSSNRKESPKTAAAEYEAFTSAEPTSQQSGGALPVELISFKVNIELSKTPVLEWQTATETENYGFRIERKQNESDWTYLGFIAGKGYSTERISYSFNDPTATLAGTYSYKLTQIDYDGKETSFPPIEITVLAPNKTELKGNFPNPFNPRTTITYQVANTAKVSIQVYDVIGRLVQTLVNEQQLAGTYKVNFDASRLASGVYLIKMDSGAQVFVRKMLLVK